MGKTHVLKNIPICANCQFWNGEREVHIGRVMVLYDTNGSGKCTIFNSPVMAGYKCSKHKLLTTYK